MFDHRNSFAAVSVFCLLLLATGCMGLKDGKLALVQPNSTLPRAGNAYLIRGWIGVFSTGMDTLSDQIAAAGVRSQVYQDTQHEQLADQIIAAYKNRPNHEPIILIGHSYGADDVVRVSRRLDTAGIPVDLLLTIDATTPPDVPKNVKLCLNYFQTGPADFIPMFRGIPLHGDDGANVTIQNINIRKDRTDLVVPGLGHGNIDKDMKLHDEVVKDVLKICPTREVWVAQHSGATPNASADRIRNAADVRTLN
jgi:hypothetical protein